MAEGGKAEVVRPHGGATRREKGTTKTVVGEKIDASFPATLASRDFSVSSSAVPESPTKALEQDLKNP